MTRYFYDCEFHEDGSTVDLLSIGIVAENGRAYYAVNRDADWARAVEHDWLRANVLPYLPIAVASMPESDGWDWELDDANPDLKPKWQIANEVAKFLGHDSTDREDNELVAYYGAYDHVALCQLWGRMIDLPPWVPMHTIDLKPMADGLAKVGFPPDRPAQEDEHNALADARWNERFWRAQVVATQAFLAHVATQSLPGTVRIAAPTAARLIERMLSEGPNEGISAQEEADLRGWWEGYSYPPGEPEAGDVFEGCGDPECAEQHAPD